MSLYDEPDFEKFPLLDGNRKESRSLIQADVSQNLWSLHVEHTRLIEGKEKPQMSLPKGIIYPTIGIVHGMINSTLSNAAMPRQVEDNMPLQVAFKLIM